MLHSVIYYVFLGCVGFFALHAVVPRRRRSGPHPRRGGYVVISPHASGSANHTTATTHERTATSTGCSQDGPPQVGADSPGTRPALSRTTAHTDYGSSTVSRRGDRMTAADYRDYTDLSPYWRSRLEAHDRDAAA